MKPLLLSLICLALGACQFGGLGGAGGRGPNKAVGDIKPDDLQPTVRKVADADHALLWRAARGYIKGHFRLENENQEDRILETQTVEWEAKHSLFRTRITVQVIADTRQPTDARLGVVAELIQPAYLFDDSAQGEVKADKWVLVGSHEKMEEFIVARIVERYLLLKQGRDPNEFESQRPTLKAEDKAN